jgi:hypothetical protein
MAKLLKCPTCGENIELPAELSGQVMRCAGCGTAIKVKVRRGGPLPPATPDVTPAAAESALPELAPKPASAAPATSGQCPICGGTYEPSSLVLEHGRLVCRNCLAKMRGRQPQGIIEVSSEELTEIVSVPGPIITMGPAFWIGAAAAVVLIGAQVYLSVTPKPQGRLVTLTPVPAALRTAVAPQDQAGWDRDNRQRIRELMQQADALRQADDSARREQAMETYEQIGKLAEGRVIRDAELASWVNQARARAEAMRSLRDPLGEQVGALDSPMATIVAHDPPPKRPEPALSPAPREEVAEVPAEPEEAEAPEPAEPAGLAEGLAALQQALASDPQEAAAHYRQAAQEFRRVTGGAGGLTPDQVRALEGQAAADIGLRQFDSAAPRIDRAVDAVQQMTRSMLVNRVIVDLAMDRGEHLAEDLDLLRDVLAAGGTPDEQVLNLDGTLLAEIEARPGMQKGALTPYWNEYDQAERRLEARRPGERRWGVMWVTDAEVERYRRAAQRIDPARQEVETARARLERSAGLARGTSAASGADAVYRQKLQELRQIEQDLVPRTWLKRYEPAVPDPVSPELLR